jgi:chromosome segregation ATPase
MTAIGVGNELGVGMRGAGRRKKGPSSASQFAGVQGKAFTGLEKAPMAHLSAPLIGGGSGSGTGDDPFYVFKDELQSHVQQAAARFNQWRTLLEGTDTAVNSEFKREHVALGKELVTLQNNVSDLEQVLQRVQTHRSNFSHISDEELVKRQAFIREIKTEVAQMRQALTSPQTAGKMDADKKANLLRRGGAAGNVAGGSQQQQMALHSNTSFVEDQQQQQQMILREQDEHLEALDQGAQRLGHMAVAIGEEIDQQGGMLDELQEDLDRTQGRMEAVLGRMDKMLKSNSRCQTNTILVLMGTLMVLIILVAWT